MDFSIMFMFIILVYSFFKLISYSKYIMKKGNKVGAVFVLLLAVLQMSLASAAVFLGSSAVA